MQHELSISTDEAEPKLSIRGEADVGPDLKSLAARASTPWRRGRDFIADIKRELPHFAPDIVFDVGANTGTTAMRYAEEFPSATIYCFEPVEATFRELQHNLRRHPNCQSLPMGFGDEVGSVNMLFDTAHPTRSKVLDGLAAADAVPSAVTVQARMQTIDNFCDELGIAHIGLLKIDTEGYDLKVLKGARKLLEKNGVKLIQVEAGMYPGNELHVPYAELCAYLQDFGFVLFGIYDQQREWKKNLPYLRRADLAFIKSTEN